MKLKVIASGSSGNCYLLENEKECLVIEAGVPFLEVKKALDFNISKISGVVSSHVHGDHNKYLEQFKKAGISAWCLGEGFPEYNAKYMRNYAISMDDFYIRIFPLVHDVPCYGFLITHPEMGRLLYASDTEYIKYRFRDLNHIIVEANYGLDIVDREDPKYQHVMKGHMGLKTALEFISVNDNTDLRNVVLCHLSDTNAGPDAFLKSAKEVTDKEVYIARKGLEINLDLVPF